MRCLQDTRGVDFLRLDLAFYLDTRTQILNSENHHQPLLQPSARLSFIQKNHVFAHQYSRTNWNKSTPRRHFW